MTSQITTGTIENRENAECHSKILSQTPTQTDPKSVDMSKYETFEELVEELRAALENREPEIKLYLKGSMIRVVEHLLDAAAVHTGVPTQGDYIAFSCWKACDYEANRIYIGNPTEDGWLDDPELYVTDITMTMTYYADAAQERELEAKINQVLAGLNFTEETDDYHKVLAIYDYITTHVTYDNESSDDDLLQYTAYAALCRGKAVCQGVATLFYRMLLEEGIDNRLIAGWVFGGSHGWNIVKLGDLYYNTDATNDLGREQLKYFLRSAEFFESHTRDSEYDSAEFHAQYPTSADEYVPVHRFGSTPVAVTAPTCTEDGAEVRACVFCEATQTVTLPALGHRYTFYTEEPTCNADGQTIYTCSRCSHSYSDCRVPAQGHDWDVIIVQDPDEQTEGLQILVCIRCEMQIEISMSSHAHAYTRTYTVAPTCGKRGYTEHICAKCSFVKHTDYVPAAGHRWEGDYCPYCGGSRPMPFLDVAPESFYYLPVFWAVDNGITSGTLPYTFSPDEKTQRCQVVTFLWRAAGRPEPTSSVNPFDDVHAEDYFYKAVLWAVENGITNGRTETTFEPYQSCKRSEVVTFLWRADGKPEPSAAESPFSDVDASQWYGDAVLWAVENGITNGMGGDIFGTENTCRRSEVVTFLYRMYSQSL